MIHARSGWAWATAVLAAFTAPAADWPQWRGPNRDAVSQETGLRQQWPADGPPLLWTSTALGRGYSAPIVVGNRIFLTGDVGEDLHIFALDLDGRRVWQTTNGRAWNGPYPGARASCTFSEGRLYHLNAHGRVACLEATTGSELWSVDLVQQFGAKIITWGLSENLLVDGPRLVVTPGGHQGLIAALDKKTGATVWVSEPLRLGTGDPPAHERLTAPAGEVDAASYTSPMLIPLGQRRLLVSCSLRHVFGVNADNGQLLWTRPLPTKYQVIASTPVRVGDAVFVTAPDSDGGKLYGLTRDGPRIRVETRWHTDLDTCHGGVVHVNGALFGARYRQPKEWVCLDARTGTVRYQLTDFAKGALVYADHRLYCLSEEGEVALLNPTTNAFEFAGRFRLVAKRTSDAWTHPVIAHGRLYLRFHETLFCYDIRAK